MKARVLAVVAFVALVAVDTCGCVGPTRGPHTHLSIAQQDAAAVWIDVDCAAPFGGPSRFWASGGIVSSRHVLTARHVVESCPGEIPSIHVTTIDGRRYRMAWFRWLPGDAALLERVDAGHWDDAVRPLVAEPARNGRVCVLAVAPERRRVCGVVEDVHAPRLMVRYDGDTIPGNSGSLIFDRFGHLVGVHSGHRGERDAYMARIETRGLP